MGRISVEPGLTAGGRRRFPIAFRVEFLREWDRCVERGAKARLMREHGLISATVQRWLRARDDGSMEMSHQQAAARGDTDVSQMRAELVRLRSENERLRRKASQAEAATEILGKAFELLEGITTSSDPEPQVPPMLMSADEYREWLQRQKLS